MANFIVDKDKAKATLLYIASKVPAGTVHKLYKILYFAEQQHLIKYGKPITGDRFIKMEHGPVPSYTRDKVQNNIDVDGSIKRVGNNVIVHEKPDLDELSESNLECLNASIEENKDKSFTRLKADSHKEAWQTATYGSSLDVMLIVKEAAADESVLQLIKQSLESRSVIY